jgi:coproporphyrinogen III oxidase-like Fe-S oxidoreductase
MNTKENVNWVNGHTKFKEVDEELILEILKTRKRIPDAHIYVHGPFCAQLCSFCMHQGLRVGPNADNVKKYYFEYLPELLERFKPTITNYNVSAIYFGGGTADVMPSASMDRIFGAIPDFDKIPCKVFEAHPASLSSGQISTLSLRNFQGGYVSFGLQTFDPDLCKKENRIYSSPEKLFGKVSTLQASGIPVNVDLIAFLGGANFEALQTLKEDINKLVYHVNPEIITIYPLRQAFNYMGQLTQIEKASGTELEELNKKRIDLATKMTDLLNSVIYPATEYKLWESPVDRSSKNSRDILETCMRPQYLTRLSEGKTDAIRAYNSSTPPYHDRSRSVIGFGNFGRIYSHSYINDEIVYYSMNDGWKTRYFIVHDKNDNNLNLEQIGWEVADL